jgi:site-specific DNA-methyltransferase (adenine-specific)
MITVTCEDCMDLMARYPDKYFDLAVVDPPYGIGETWKHNSRSNNLYTHESSYKNNKIPTKKYFDELFRVSENQIIWGYNYFTEILGPTNYLIFWDKLCNANMDFYSQGEIAYTSIRKPLQIIKVPWDGCRMGKETGTKKIHPHQKPVELYKRLLEKYARPGWKILDTHLGSGSIAVACLDMGYNLTACEIDKDYYEAAMERIKIHQAQGVLDFTGAIQ